MFCFQCEQTAGSKGCMGKAGVCGNVHDNTSRSFTTISLDHYIMSKRYLSIQKNIINANSSLVFGLPKWSLTIYISMLVKCWFF